MSNKITAFKNGKKISMSERAWSLLSERDKSQFTLEKRKEEPKAENILNDQELTALEKMRSNTNKKKESDAGAISDSKSTDELYAESIEAFKTAFKDEKFEDALAAINKANELKPSPYTRTKIKEVEEKINAQ